MTIVVPPPLAENARNATAPGSCARCRYNVCTGQRIARLPSGEWVHAWCAAAVPPGGRRSSPGRQ